jgi:anti-anti-sigma factor
MELFERQIKKYAIVINVNLVRATLNEAAEFREYLNEAILGTDIDLIVNLSDCQHLDSTFLGVLVSGYKKLKSKNRSLVIIEPTDQSRVFLTLNSIGKIFPLYDSVTSALADIENKKMLENIAENIEDETVEVKTEVIPFEQTEEVISNSPVLVQEELTAIELNDSINTIDESYENETLENEFEQEAERIENLTIDNEILAEKINFESFNNVEEVYHEEIAAYPEPKPLYSEINFKKGSVDWAFGFN